MGIHNFEKGYLSALEKVKRSSISEKNKQFLMKFVNDLALENLSKARLTKYLTTLRLVAEKLNKDFDLVTIEDLKQFIGKIQQRDDYSPWTKKMYKLLIRRFFKWLKGIKGKNKYPEIVDWINITMHKSERNLPSSGDLLDEEDIIKLINNAYHPRDRALIAILWESGARVSEIGNLKLSNVIFDKYGIVITVQGKTGSRKIRLIFCTSYLSTWINMHPFKADKNASLWVNIGTCNHNQPLQYGNIRKLLLDLGARAKVNKRINPHMFRHSRATFMANHLTEFQMNQYFGWIQGSDMPSTYVHMSGKEVDSAILKMNGIQTENNSNKSALLPKICPRCDTINSSDDRVCIKCAAVIDPKYAMELDELNHKDLQMRSTADQLMTALFKDEEIRAILLKKLGVTMPV